MRFLEKIFGKKCAHVFPSYLYGYIIEGRFPYQTRAWAYKECLYCRKVVKRN